MLFFRRRRRLCYLSFLSIIFIISIMHVLPEDFVMQFADQCVKNKSSHEYRCVIIVRFCAGRLGNKMFLFASAYGLARLNQCHLYIEKGLLKSLNVIFRIKLNNIITKMEEVDCLKNISRKYTVCRFFS